MKARKEKHKVFVVFHNHLPFALIMLWCVVHNGCEFMKENKCPMAVIDDFVPQLLWLALKKLMSMVAQYTNKHIYDYM